MKDGEQEKGNPAAAEKFAVIREVRIRAGYIQRDLKQIGGDRWGIAWSQLELHIITPAWEMPKSLACTHIHEDFLNISCGNPI